jgi:hypothetical protein
MRPRRPRTLVYLTWLLMLLAVATLAVSLAPAQGEVGRGSLRGSLVAAPRPVPVGITARLAERSDADLARVVSRLRAAGVDYVKEDVSWRALEPSPGVYDWSSMDRWVSAATEGGLGIIALPLDPPSWATPAWNVAPVGGSGRLAAFSSFVRSLVERYGAHGSFWKENPELPARPIRYYDIWNEPYVARFWGRGFPDPGGYARMFRAVVRGARPADPRARFLLEADTRVLAGGRPRNPFLAKMLRAVPDLARYAYAVSVHPYQGDGDSPRECSRPAGRRELARDWKATALDFCRIADIRRLLDARGARRVRIWITEVGWSSAPRARNSVTKAAQARYVRQVFDLLRTRYRGMVSGLVWYEYQSSQARPWDQEDYFGLVRPDGAPKPAWHSFARQARRGL